MEKDNEKDREKIIVCSYDEKLLPEKHSDGAVCWDLRIAEDIVIEPGQLFAVGTGIKTFIPHGRHAKMYARSGLPVKMGLMIANSVAIFDADYRGEYIAQLYNFTQETKIYPKYTRMCQIEFGPYYAGSGTFGLENGTIPEIEFVSDERYYANFEQEFGSKRGAGRFNSTGEM